MNECHSPFSAQRGIGLSPQQKRVAAWARTVIYSFPIGHMEVASR